MARCLAVGPPQLEGFCGKGSPEAVSWGAVDSIVQAFLGSVDLGAGHRAGSEEVGASRALGGVRLPLGRVTSHWR